MASSCQHRVMYWKIFLTTGVIIYNFDPVGAFGDQIARALSSFIAPVFAPVKDPSLYYNAEELICSAGYPVQTHKVETEDGYILGIQRIPYGRKDVINSNRVKRAMRRFHLGLQPEFKNCDNGSLVQTSNRPPVIVQHGLSVASDVWVVQGPPHDLATLLADSGYDVWLGNSRGNYYSRKHRSLDPSDPEFWNFSFHESGYYDLPALIDYILKVTNQDRLYYIGHSMGTTSFFVMASTRPEYNDKVRLFAAMAPAVSLDQAFFNREKKILLNSGIKLAKAYERSRMYEAFPRVNWAPLVAHGLCRKGSPFQDLCYDMIFSLTGVQSKLYLRKNFARILAHSFAGFSLKTVMHFIQLLKTNQFGMYDYGRNTNLRLYGDEKPPPYDLSQVTCPVALYYSSGDLIVDYRDVEKLLNWLPNVVRAQKIKEYNHADYQWAYTAPKLVYSDIMSQMARH